MKTTLILFLLSISPAFSQVDCAELGQNFTGKCESYNEFSGIRSKFTYKKGTLHGKFEESFQNGQQRASGSYKAGLLNGNFTSFYVSGEKMAEAKFKAGSGNFIVYHTNGKKKTEGQFEEGRASGKWSFYNSNGEMTRELDKHNSRLDMYRFLVGEQSNKNEMAFGDFFNSFDDSGFSFSFGDGSDSTFARMQKQLNESVEKMRAQMDQMIQGFSDTSLTRSFQFDTTFSFNNFGDSGGFFSFKSFGDSSFSKSFQFDTIFGDMPQRANPFFNSKGADLVDFPDTEPNFVGGEDAMNAFIEREMQPVFTENEIQKDGTVFIEAIVEKDGSISNSRVALGIDSQLDDKAMRIIKAMPMWKPATVDGQSVRSRCIIPVTFGRK